VLLSGSTADALKTRPVMRRLDLLQVKGKVRPTAVYESLAHHTAESFPKLAAVIGAYEAGFDAYQQRDWAMALQRFGDALELAPSDRPSRIFIDRCRYYRENPPPDEWNGVWIMEEK
jgi:adenylate cyclase